jgi:hypothetical protein
MAARLGDTMRSVRTVWTAPEVPPPLEDEGRDGPEDLLDDDLTALLAEQRAQHWFRE